MSMIVWGLAAWALASIPVGLMIARGIARMNPPCEIADTTNWDDIRTALAGMLPASGGVQPAGLAASLWHDAEAEAETVAHALPAARKVA